MFINDDSDVDVYVVSLRKCYLLDDDKFLRVGALAKRCRFGG